MKNFRTAFAVTVGLNVLLAAGLAFLWWQSNFRKSQAENAQEKPAGTSSKASGGEAEPVSPWTEPPLAAVQLTPQRLQSIGVKFGVVESKPVEDEIRTVGTVEVDETRLAYVQVRVAGWIQKVFADSTYQYVRKGEPLFTIYSPDFVTTEQEYLLAKKSRTELAQSSVPGVASGAASLLDAAVERLDQWQVPGREIANLESTGKVQRDLVIDSPVSGYVTERNAIPNMYVQPDTKLYTVADLSTVWVYAEILQTDIGKIKLGDPAIVTTDAYPGLALNGRVSFISPQVDMTTRTQRVRMVFSNAGIKLTPGMFMNVRLLIPMGRQLTIPASGVLQSGTRQIAFVDHGDGYLEPREIELGPQVGDQFIIRKGLKSGERVVTSANFLIDSESQLQAALGSFAPSPPGAGAAASTNKTSQANLDFSTIPAPPHKGDNTFRVKLTEGNGSPVTGAQVTVTFFMPAMPSMGMAAMRTVSSLNDKGGGVYEGSGNLASGGTWQVTIVAQKNGQILAGKQLTVNAEGGM